MEEGGEKVGCRVGRYVERLGEEVAGGMEVSYGRAAVARSLPRRRLWVEVVFDQVGYRASGRRRSVLKFRGHYILHLVWQPISQNMAVSLITSAVRPLSHVHGTFWVHGYSSNRLENILPVASILTCADQVRNNSSFGEISEWD